MRTDFRMTIWKAFGVIGGCTLLVGAIGLGVGYGLGTFVPSYYRNVFRKGGEPGFDPVSVGLGQGMTQGIAGGVVVVLALVAILSWRDGWVQSKDNQIAPRSVLRRRLLIAGALVAFLFCLSCGVLGGIFKGEQNVYQRSCEEQRDAIKPVLASDPTFAEVSIDDDYWDADSVILTGSVRTSADFTRLRERMTEVIGKKRAEYAVSFVQVLKDDVTPRRDR